MGVLAFQGRIALHFTAHRRRPVESGSPFLFLPASALDVRSDYHLLGTHYKLGADNV